MNTSSVGPRFSTVFLNTVTAREVVTPLLEAGMPPSILRLVKSSSRPIGPSAAGEPNGPTSTPAKVELLDLADASALDLIPASGMVSATITTAEKHFVNGLMFFTREVGKGLRFEVKRK